MSETPTCPHCGTEVHIHRPSDTFACQTEDCRAFHGMGMENLVRYPLSYGVAAIKEALAKPKAEGGLNLDRRGL